MDRPNECLSDRKKHSAFDIIIVAILATGIVIPMMLVISGKATTSWIRANVWWINSVAVSEAAFLVMWMFFDGKNSPLWRWLPPFCAFPKIMWVRWAVVIALFVGTVTGALFRP